MIHDEDCDPISIKQNEIEKRVRDDLKTLGADDTLLNKVWELFDMTEKPFKPVTAQKLNNLYGVRWDFDTGFLSVLFGPGDDWQWETKTIVGKKNDEGDGGYTRHITYNGGPSFILHDKPYYSLPEEVDKIISIPEPFSQDYQPIIPKREYKVQWTMNYYDGMLSGYCEYKGNLCYFDCIDETTYTGNRMFAVYKLSTFEKISARFHHYKWNLTLYNPTLWNIHMKIWRWKQKKFPKPYVNKAEQFRKSHKVLGYFEW